MIATSQGSHALSFTADNGKEFTAHSNIHQALEVSVHFAYSYHAWERGFNENTSWIQERIYMKLLNYILQHIDYIKSPDYILGDWRHL